VLGLGNFEVGYKGLRLFVFCLQKVDLVL